MSTPVSSMRTLLRIRFCVSDGQQSTRLTQILAVVCSVSMIDFLLKVWDLAKPYRWRLFLGVLTGVIGGLIEPLMIFTIVLVYSLIFPSAGASPLGKLDKAPEWLA